MNTRLWVAVALLIGASCWTKATEVSEGILRTPDHYFDNLIDHRFSPNYMECANSVGTRLR